MNTWTNEMMAKALLMSDLDSGGGLPREVQDTLLKMTLTYANMLSGDSGIRRRSVRQRSGQLDKMWLHQHITEQASAVFSDGGVAQGEGGGSGDTSATIAQLYDTSFEKFGVLKWDTEKMVSRTGWSTEFLRENIERGTLESELRRRLLARVATDFEDLAINGDTSIATTDPRSKLLKANDGWDKLTEQANIVDAKAAFVTRSLFSDMIKKMPRWMRRERQNLRWFFNDDIEQDWLDFLGGRMDGVGSDAVRGNLINPLGIPFFRTPLIPSDKKLVTGEATPGRLLGTLSGPFRFVKDSSDEVKFTVDNADNANLINVDFSAGGGGVPAQTGTYVLTANEVCAIINAKVIGAANQPASGLCAVPDPVHDRIILLSPTTGASSSVEVQDGAANNAIAVLGFTNDQRDAGQDAAAGTDHSEGTFIWLTDPANFSWIAITSDPNTSADGLRVYSEFNKDRDRIELIMYANTDCLLENSQGVVKANNVRTKQLTAI